MRIRTKFLALVLIVAGGFLLETAISIGTYQRIASMHRAIESGVRLIAQARRAHGLMTDLVFDLFSPRMYSSLQGIILAPTSISTQKEWTQAVAEFRGAYAVFIGDPVLKGLLSDEELRSAYKVADTLSDRAFKELQGLESDFVLLRDKYSGSEELYSRLLMSNDESLYAIFDHVRQASFYLGNIFESYLDRFVGVFELSAAQAELRALLAFGIVSALLTAFAVAGVLGTTRSILANIGLVDKAVERISEGDFSSRVAPLGHDELGRLAERVNLFAGRLKANVESLASILGAVNAAVPDAPDLDRILAIVVDELLRDEAAECAAVCLLKGGRVFRHAWSGFRPVVDWEPLAAACYGGPGTSPRRLLIRDASGSGGIGQDAEAFAPDLASLGLDPSLASVLALPLAASKGLEGLCVFGRRRRAFTDLELSQLESFSDYASQVIDNAIANAALRARDDAEYRALQAQIQPHFMYNVLNGLVALNRMGERAALESSLHALKDMLRYTIEHGQRATVGEEFAFLELYCRLQKLRFEERFAYDFELEPEAEPLHIPKLLVQPLLENAVIHGVEPSLKPCRARVSAAILGARLVMQVEDDGVGCDPSAITEQRRIGIGNVRERIALLYASASLELAGAPAAGFRARISIPLAELERA